MEKQERQGGPIRLTNRTALALRRSARQARTMALVQAAAATAVLAVAAVLLGIRWLPAVPILTAVIVLVDASLYVSGRAKYLSLTGQAICAEAAARAIREQTADQKRREKARRDLDGAKADVRRAVQEAEAARESEMQGNTAQNQEREEEQEEPQEKKPERRSQTLSGETRPITRTELERLRSARDAEPKPKEEETAEQDAKDQAENPAPARRRRRQAALTVLRAEDVK